MSDSEVERPDFRHCMEQVVQANYSQMRIQVLLWLLLVPAVLEVQS
jgi:hypothetical protein